MKSYEQKILAWDGADFHKLAASMDQEEIRSMARILFEETFDPMFDIASPEFIPSFTVDELFQMRDYLYCHPIDIRYDFNEYDDVSILIYDYIRWWVSDLLDEGEINRAKTVLNAGYADYEEEYEGEEEEIVEEQMKDHELRLFAVKEDREFFLVGNKLMRTYEVIDDTIDEEDGERFGACWDYELYDVQLKVVDSGQLGKCGNMSREEAVQRVLERNKLNIENRTYIPATEALVELTECLKEGD